MNKTKEVIVLDPKRSNAINIGMTKLPPPRSIKAAILKMDPTVINREGIEVINYNHVIINTCLILKVKCMWCICNYCYYYLAIIFYRNL